MSPDEPLSASSGARIRAARLERGWTQDDLAAAVGVSRSAVQLTFSAAVSPPATASAARGSQSAVRASVPILEADMDDLPHSTPSDAPPTRAERAPGLSPEERDELAEAIRRLQASRGLI